MSSKCFWGSCAKLKLEKEILRPIYSNMCSNKHTKSNLFSSTRYKYLADKTFKCLLWNHKFYTVIASHYSSDKNMSDVNNENCLESQDICQEQDLTPEDLNSLMGILKDILEYRKENISSWILERKVKVLCQLYKCLSNVQKKKFLQELAGGHAVKHSQVYEAAKSLSEINDQCSLKIMKTEERLRNLLTPQYLWLFLFIGKLENGVKFLVDLRTDVLSLISEKNAKNDSAEDLQKLNATLRDLLAMWFSVGFLELERVTWKSSCEMLEKISKYEAVHPIRNWIDLKRRVGAYRRCFIFLHRSMPGEPVIVLHTALTDKISSSLEGIVSARMSANQPSMGKMYDNLEEDLKNVKAAVFYSISSSHKGLKGIELGNYLIKRVIRELQNELPQITEFSSLSPIPLFRMWLLDKLKNAQRGNNDILFQEEIKKFQKYFKSLDYYDELRRLLIMNGWVHDSALVALLKEPLMRLCVNYLYLQKRRGFALDSVANFHLKNGAVMWRLNWGANFLPQGLSSSCGIMVNYRYFLDETETRSVEYFEKQKISASDEILKLAESAKELMSVSNISKL